MSSTPRLRLRVQVAAYALEHAPNRRGPLDDAWIALVRAPEGLTVIREAAPDTAPADRWVGLYDADAGHGLDVPGLLASVVGPLAAAGVPVFVASTYHADLVLVPEPKWDAATVALRAAGHTIVDAAG